METDDIVLRNYRPEDLDTIVALDEQCFAEDFRFSRRSMRSFAEARNATTLIGQDTSTHEIVAFAILHIESAKDEHYGYIITLDVAQDRRRQGLARRLVQSLEQQLLAVNVPSIALHVHTKNTAAIRFYERLGYIRLGLEPNFYARARTKPADGELDAYVYRKDLAASS